MASDTPDGERFVNEDWFTRFMRGRRNDIASLTLCALGVIVVVSVITHNPFDPSINVASDQHVQNALGPWGAKLADSLLQWLGWAGAALGLMLFAWGVTMLVHGPRRRGPKLVTLRVLAGILTVFGLATAASSLPIPVNWPFAVGLGGVLGDAAYSELSTWAQSLMLPFPGVLAGLMGLTGAIVGGFAGYGVTPNDVADAADTASRLADTLAERARRAVETLTRRVNHEPVKLQPVSTPQTRQLPPGPSLNTDDEFAPSPPQTAEQPAPPAPAPVQPEPAPTGLMGIFGGGKRRERTKARLTSAPSAIALPDLDLLEPARERRTLTDDVMLEDRAEHLENVLADYGVKGQVVGAKPGPLVTMFEFEPARGVRSSRIIGLSEDIARSLSAQSARVAVVPGRSVIGIELPSPRLETVYIKTLLSSDAYNSRKLALPLVLGETISGEPFVADLARMPHLLIAGATGSGKSVGINAMILSLMYRLPPERCRFIMVDPKMLELSMYDGIPHLLSPVLTDPQKAVAALKWACREMERRYALMSKIGVRNISGLNRRMEDAIANGYDEIEVTTTHGFDQDTGQPKISQEDLRAEIMPYIVIIIDEMADLMQVAGKDIEGLVQRLAQMARAAGIHLITATQRPSVDVITGTIKANFPERISYRLPQKGDSRTILGEQGAEQLLGRGDLLYLAGGARVRRLHGPFVSDEEIERVANFFRAQAAPEYVEGITEDPDEAPAPSATPTTAAPGASDDELYERAVDIVLTDRRASTSYLQRKLSIGYNRAATLMERLEENGVVSAANHAGRREILASAPPMAGEA